MGCLGCWLDLFQFVRQLGRLPDFLGWRCEGLLVNFVRYCWKSLLQIVFHLVILLELIESCLGGWLGLFQFVGLFGKLPVFLGWRVEGLLVSVEKYCWRDLFQIAIRSVVLLELADGPCWSFESSVVIAGNYGWRNLLQFAFRLVILLALAAICLEDWQ